MSDGWKFEKLTAEEKSALATFLHHYTLLLDGGSRNMSFDLVKRAEMQRDSKTLRSVFEKLFVEDGQVIPLN